MSGAASELARRLAANAEAVCREYLSNGRRQGRYWVVGDARNARRSIYLRLTDATSGNGAAGKWTDAATGEHGDLLDVIRESCGFVDFRDVADEARRFLACRARNRAEPQSPFAAARPRRVAAKRRSGSSPCRSRSPARSSRPTCAIAASRLSTIRAPAVSSALLLSPRRQFADSDPGRR